MCNFADFFPTLKVCQFRTFFIKKWCRFPFCFRKPPLSSLFPFALFLGFLSLQQTRRPWKKLELLWNARMTLLLVRVFYSCINCTNTLSLIPIPAAEEHTYPDDFVNNFSLFRKWRVLFVPIWSMFIKLFPSRVFLKSKPQISYAFKFTGFVGQEKRLFRSVFSWSKTPTKLMANESYHIIMIHIDQLRIGAKGWRDDLN